MDVCLCVFVQKDLENGQGVFIGPGYITTYVKILNRSLLFNAVLPKLFINLENLETQFIFKCCIPYILLSCQN